MISHNCYFLATHPKLQVITSKSLTRRLITSYRVRNLTNHVLNELLLSKLEFSQQWFLLLFHLFYSANYLFNYFILPRTFQYIDIWRWCNFVFCFVFISLEVKCKYILTYIKNSFLALLVLCTVQDSLKHRKRSAVLKNKFFNFF